MRLPAFLVSIAASSTAAQCTPAWSALSGVTGAPEVMILGTGGTRNAPMYAAPLGHSGFPPSMTIGQLDHGIWSQLGGPLSGPFDNVSSMAMWPPSAPAIVIAGDFQAIGGVAALNVARWGGSDWIAINSELTVDSLAVYDDDHEGPAPPLLYRGSGILTGHPEGALQRWDGVQWTVMPALLLEYPATHGIRARALCAFDDDASGARPPGLYIAGTLGGGGSVTCLNIIRWDGQQYEALGNGLNSTVYCMAVYDDDGPGPRAPALFAGGSFTHHLARWDGQAWSNFFSIPSGGVYDMVVYDDDGLGPHIPGLAIGGSFAIPSSKITFYRGFLLGFDALGGGLTGAAGGSEARRLGVYDEDGPGPNPGGLYVSGDFNFAGGVPIVDFARWGCPLPPGGPCYPDCNQDAQLNLSDFGCFQAKFALGDAYADCNGDGLRNLSDFGCFSTKFALGCP